MAFSVAYVAFPSGMPTTFDDGFPLGMAPSYGLMNELIAPESMVACFPPYLSFSTLYGSRWAFARCRWVVWGVVNQAPKLQPPRFLAFLVVVDVSNFGAGVDLHLRLVGLSN